MALFGTGSSTAYWRAPTWSAVPGGPYSLSCWVRNIPGSTAGIIQFQTGTTGSPQVGLATFNAALYFQDYQDASHNYQLFGTTSTYLPATATTWHHLLWAETAAGVVTGWIDGIAFAPAPTIVGALAATARTELAVANNWANSAGLPTTALIAETAWWQDLLSGADARALYQGTSPLRVRTGRLRNYWPLRGSLIDAGPAQVGLVPVGTASAVYGDHPKVELPPRRRVYAVAAGVSRALTPNAASATGSAAAALSRSRALVAAATASSSQAAAESAVRALTAAGTASGASAAALGRSRALAAAGTASTGQTASTGRGRALTPNAATAASSQAASDAAVRAMVAAAVAASAQNGSVKRSRALAGSAAASTTQAASIAKFIQGQLAGQAFAAGSASAALHAIRGLAGAATAGSAAAGAIARSRGLAGTGAAATGTQAASLGRSRQLAPSGGSAVSGQTGALAAQHALRITGTASASAQATLGRTRPLSGAASAASSQTGRVTAGDLPAPAVVYNVVRFERDLRTVRFARDIRTVRFTRADMAKPKSFKRKHPLSTPWYGISLGEPLTGTPSIMAACSVTNAVPIDVRSVQIATGDNTTIEFQAFGGDDGTLWTLTASATSAVDQSLLVVDVLLPVERHFGG